MSTPESEHLIAQLKQMLPRIDAKSAPLPYIMARLIVLLDARLTELENNDACTISGPAT